MRVLAISGSLRAASYNTALLREAARHAPPDMQIELYEGLEALPPYNEDREGDPPAEAVRLRQAIAATDALLISTPEYNGTVPGQLKHAIDWASRPKGGRGAPWEWRFRPPLPYETHGRRGGVATQRPAKPSTPVRFRSSPFGHRRFLEGLKGRVNGGRPPHRRSREGARESHRRTTLGLTRG